MVPMYVKRTYSSDPFFEHSKVIYSVYAEEHDNPIRAGFDKRAMCEGVSAEDVKCLKGRTMKTSVLHKLAIDFADGVICGSESIQPDVERHVKKCRLPYVPYSAEGDYREEYARLIAELSPRKE